MSAGLVVETKSEASFCECRLPVGLEVLAGGSLMAHWREGVTSCGNLSCAVKP